MARPKDSAGAEVVQAEIVQKLEIGVEADATHEIGRRHIARIGERLPRQHGTEKGAIGIVDARRAFRNIGHEIRRLQRAALESERIDERLQRRARRTLRAREIDRAIAPIAIVGGADIREHRARAALDDHQRDLPRAGGTPEREIAPRELREPLLKRQIDGGADARIMRRNRRHEALAREPFIAQRQM